MRFSLPAKLLGVAVSLLLIASTSGTALAVTLGQVKTISYLNQPLEAEIELFGLAPGQHEDLRIRVANQDEFDRLGIVYTRLLSDLKFDVVQSRGRWIVRVRSRRPVSEPFIELPVQMTWPGGRMVRQYTLLLDPLTLTRPATVSRTTTTAPAQRARPSSAQTGTLGSASYGPVQRGETLWPIAQKLKPRGITTKQMAIALLRANPQAFINNDINKLRAGAVLSVPPLGVIEQLDAAAASREFAEQTRQWRAAVATSPREVTTRSTAAPAPTQADSATARPSEAPTEASDQAASAQDDAQLRIVADQSKELPKEDAAIEQQLLVTMEEIESNRITTAAIESRLAKLEQELTKMQALVDLKDQQIAALQSELAERGQALPSAGAADEVAARAPAEAAATAPPPAPAVAAPAETVPAEPVIEAPVELQTAPLPTSEPAPRAPWYDQYLWLLWALLGVIGLIAIGLMIRRLMPSRMDVAHAGNVAIADLPSVGPPGATPMPEAPAPAEIKQAERDFRAMSRKPAPQAPATPSPAAPLPDVGQAETPGAAARKTGPTGSLLDGSKKLDQRPPQAAGGVDDRDIAQWVEELGAEIEQLDAATGEERKVKPAESPTDELDDEIPSILSELDDQLAGRDTAISPQPVNIDLAPLDEPEPDKIDRPQGANSASTIEDDTFAMSLDLARAYLEIGDNDGARDMLKQALSGARDPEHRRQIEELLKQID